MSLDPAEVELIHALQRGLTATLDREDDDDPVIARLFPTTIAGDPPADAQLRQLLRDDLLEERRAGLNALVEVLDRARAHRGRLRVDLVDDEPELVLGVLNDLRLAIGAQLRIDELARETVEPNDPAAHQLAVMDHLAWLQEQLIAVIDPESVGPDA